MGEKEKQMIEVEAVAIPASVARDLIAALSAENVRLRADLKKAGDDAASAEQSADYYKRQMEDYRSKYWELDKRERAKRAEKRRQTVATRKGQHGQS